MSESRSATPGNNNDDKHYVVVLKRPAQLSTFLTETGIKPTRSFDVINAFSANLTGKQFLELSSHPDVASIADDDCGLELESSSESSEKKRKNTGDEGRSGRKESETKVEAQPLTRASEAQRRKKRKKVESGESSSKPTDHESITSDSTT